MKDLIWAILLLVVALGITAWYKSSQKSKGNIIDRKKDFAEYAEIFTIRKITDEEFRQILSKEVGKSLTWEECQWAWLGYRIEVPQRNLDMLKKLKAEGYRLILLSNTNAFMQQWAETDFDGNGGSISDYFDAMYRSYECKMMKPSDVFFMHVLRTEKIIPSETLFLDDGPRNVAAASEMGIFTYCPKNGEDWTEKIYDYLNF